MQPGRVLERYGTRFDLIPDVRQPIADLLVFFGRTDENMTRLNGLILDRPNVANLHEVCLISREERSDDGSGLRIRENGLGDGRIKLIRRLPFV